MAKEHSVAWFQQQAVDRTGLNDFGDDYFEVGLAAYCDDLNGGHLSEAGRGLLTRQMINDLARRLHVIDYLKRNPGIHEVTIPPILYVTGLERTGTTLLHNLLSLDPKSRALPRWQLMYPVPAPEAATCHNDPRIDKVQAAVDQLRGTKLERMHWVDAADPEECYWGLLNGFGILGGSVINAMPHFREARTEEATYRAVLEYRSVIRILLWKNPLPEGGHLVLKSPQFCGALGALKRALPECRMVITHRDPYRALVSVCNLLAHILEPLVLDETLYDRHGPVAGRTVKETPKRLGDVMSYAEAGHQLANVAYPQLVENPESVLADIYEQHGMEMPDDLPAAVQAFIGAQRAGRRARPAADFADFGIDAEALYADPEVAAYRKQFGVARERVRLTGG